VRFVSIAVSAIRPVLIVLIFSTLAIYLPKSHAQGTASGDTTNSFSPPASSQVGGSVSLSGANTQIDESPDKIEAHPAKIEVLGDYRRILNGDYVALPSGGFAVLIAATDLNSFGLSFEAGAVQLARGSTADINVGNAIFLQTGLVARHYFTPSHVLLRPYVTLNANYFWMAWGYRTPVTLDDGSTIDTDSAKGIDASASVGLCVRLHRHVNLFGEFNGGGVAVMSLTEAGVDNNFMGSFGYVGVKAGLSVVF
jgi:hypothetical protein